MTNRPFFSLTFSVLALLLTTGCVFAQDGSREPLIHNVHEIDATAGGSIEMDEIIGDVEITTHGRNQVVLEEMIYVNDRADRDAKERAEEYLIGIEERGNRIRIRGDRPNGNWNNWRRGGPDVWVRYVLVVPERFDVDVSTSGGDISITGLSGEVDFSTSGGDLDLKDVEGSVDLSTSGGDITLSNVKGELDASTSGGDIEADDISSGASLSTSGGDIEVAGVGGDLDASTSGGDLDLEDILGDVDASTSGGDVRLIGISGSVDASTSGGTIQLRDIGGMADVSTNGGDIEGDDLRGGIDARTNAGDIDLAGVGGDVRASTSVGNISLEMMPNFEGNVDIELDVHHGDIELMWPSSKGARIDAVAEKMGRYDDDDNAIRSDFDMTTDRSDRRATHRTATLGDGSSRVKLEASGGTIRIRKR
ncbi:MAG: hypothetical protein RhofKO_20070 [Rhodothermales bacterium]